jgi:predicted esterase
MLSYAVAAVAPDRIAGAVPISGMVPQALLPARGSSVPVRAVHGTADSVLAHAPTAAAVEAWRGRGGDVTLTSYDGVDHTVSAEMRARVYADIEAMLSR